MSSLRQVILANIESAEAAIEKFKGDLTRTPAEYLDRPITALRAEIELVCAHLFSQKGNEIAAQAQIAAAPQPVLSTVPNTVRPDTDNVPVQAEASAVEAPVQEQTHVHPVDQVSGT